MTETTLTPTLQSWLEYARPILNAALGEPAATSLLKYPTSLAQPPAPFEGPPVVSAEHRSMFDQLIAADCMALVPCELDGKPTTALCAVRKVEGEGNVYILPLFIPVNDQMQLVLPSKEEMAALSSSPDTPAVGVMPTLPTATDRPMLSFTPELARKLKKHYEDAVCNKRTSFVFEGRDLLVSYAKYLVEYLTTQGLLTE